ncbi:MAG TPA: von Willebrand factor type A domain-containing protein, partial [Vicinamibacteria bacterium]|nr:von Willebrand factor type A domain-containing protein [Vicinamibacteria bacterium]
MTRSLSVSLVLFAFLLPPLAPDEISGVVTDSQDQVLPGVTVILTLPDGSERTRVTNERGEFVFRKLKVGRHTLRVELAGFMTRTLEGLVPGMRAQGLRVALEIGGLTETVTVTGESPSVHVVSSAIASQSAVETLKRVRVPSARFLTESYDYILDNPFQRASHYPLSTFSTDVDTASYSNMRRFLAERELPPKDSIRIEELLNYFEYEYPDPKGKDPISVRMELAPCPWKTEHRLLAIGLKAKEIEEEERAPLNLVFLVDVSGSMEDDNKLPLVKSSLRMLTSHLRDDDAIAIVVYAGASGVVLPRTKGAERGTILEALDRLEAGGSTNGGEGIELAYRIAEESYDGDALNRVILATDGDFNVGISDEGALVRLIEDKAKSGVFLTVLGFGMGNYKDSMLEKLADKGNGNYAYIDTSQEARKVLYEQATGTLVTVAKDVKLQIEFNPARVEAYRLIGYENRMLEAEDFEDDRKDAGDVGAGHLVTALYEIVPVGASLDLPEVSRLKYQRPAQLSRAAETEEVLTLKLRYKHPDGIRSREMQRVLTERDLHDLDDATKDFKWAAAVAAFGMTLRDSPYRGEWSYDEALALAREGLPPSPDDYRSEFLNLVASAREIALVR